MMSNYKCLLAGILLLGISAPQAAEAVLIADFQADYQATTPKAGWAYQYSGLNVAIGGEGYTSLLYDAGNSMYNVSGAGIPASGAGDYAYIAASGAIHPGRGPTNGPGDTPTALNHYAIAQYTLSTAGPTTIDALALTSNSGSSNGVVLFVNVNADAPLLNTVVSGGSNYGGPTTINLGNLSIGDRIYVAVGPNGDHSYDGSTLGFQINQVPEPATAVLMLIGVTGFAALRRRRRQQ